MLLCRIKLSLTAQSSPRSRPSSPPVTCASGRDHARLARWQQSPEGLVLTTPLRCIGQKWTPFIASSLWWILELVCQGRAHPRSGHPHGEPRFRRRLACPSWLPAAAAGWPRPRVWRQPMAYDGWSFQHRHRIDRRASSLLRRDRETLQCYAQDDAAPYAAGHPLVALPRAPRPFLSRKELDGNAPRRLALPVDEWLDAARADGADRRQFSSLQAAGSHGRCPSPDAVSSEHGSPGAHTGRGESVALSRSLAQRHECAAARLGAGRRLLLLDWGYGHRRRLMAAPMALT